MACRLFGAVLLSEPVLDYCLKFALRSEPVMVSLLTHVCVTWPQWVKHMAGLLSIIIMLLTMLSALKFLSIIHWHIAVGGSLYDAPTCSPHISITFYVIVILLTMLSAMSFHPLSIDISLWVDLYLIPYMLPLISQVYQQPGFHCPVSHRILLPKLKN